MLMKSRHPPRRTPWTPRAEKLVVVVVVVVVVMVNGRERKA